MKKRRVIIVIAAVVVVLVAVLLLMHMPERIQGTITVCNGNGETAVVEMDLQYYSNLILPSYVKGTLTVDGIAYTDRYTKLKEFPGVSDNRLYPSDWWKTEESVPYNMTFVRSDCTDPNSAMLNRIDVLEIEFRKGVSRIHYMYTDGRDTMTEGISFWGPAQNAGEAKQIAEAFGYQAP